MTTTTNPTTSDEVVQQKVWTANFETNIPQCTYRLQFNHGFTLKQAIELIPYLKQLGVSHCYASPLLAARPGSMHGYDIVDHGHLNPEIGSDADFNCFCAELKANDMALIVDIVPNHMGVGSDNIWWMDILENGRASAYANYFDIDWMPLKDELRGKVLLPVLGNQYGQVLENGEIRLGFAKDTGTFNFHYYDHFWPLNPNTYPFILKQRLDELSLLLAEKEWSFLEYQSIITALENLPYYSYLNETQMDTRQREKTVTLKRLLDLCQQDPKVEAFIAENVADFNQLKDQPENIKRMHQLLEAQVYRLASWRVASDEINYRRFFDVNDLAGLNMNEAQNVFQDTHGLLLRWVEEGKVAGFRIDHPDGLYDPAGYFRQLQTEAAQARGMTFDETAPANWPLYLVAEKILAPYEDLSPDWAVHGTSGYEFANHLTGLFINKANEEDFSRVYREFTGLNGSLQERIYECKRLIMKESMASELSVLTNQLNRLSEKDWTTRDFTWNDLRRALTEVVAVFPVYRTYIVPDAIGKKDGEYIQWAVQAAKKHNPLVDPSIYDFIYRILTLNFEPYHNEDYVQEATHFAMKFQQYTGPVMAKGMEDTLFYRYNRLVSMNEVGGDLQHFGVSVNAFHHQNLAQLKTRPYGMLNTSTHDSKRSEDVRARINVLSEMPELWEKNLQRWSRINRNKKSLENDLPVPDANDEYLLYQTLLGVWPFEEIPSDYPVFQERIQNYMMKAIHEAKVHTSWINNNIEYEEGLTKFVQALLSDENSNAFLEDFLPFQKQVAFWGMLNALSQTILKLTVPGVPDIYQGTELWDFSLVDPDNRRPVNYKNRLSMLQNLVPVLSGTISENDISKLLSSYSDGQVKLFVTAACLNYRQKNTTLFHRGDYIPLDVTGHGAEHLIAFARCMDDKAVLILAPRLMYTLTEGQQVLPVGEAVWKDTTIQLPAEWQYQHVKNIFTMETTSNPDSELPVSGLLKTFPVGFFEITLSQ